MSFYPRWAIARSSSTLRIENITGGTETNGRQNVISPANIRVRHQRPLGRAASKDTPG